MFKKRLLSILLAFVLMLTVVSVTAAAHTTINTNDGSVDGNWSLITVISNDGDDVADDNYDIDHAWITNEADDSAFYFRVSMVGMGQLPHDYSSFEARLDCDQNGSFYDSVDVTVYYAINGATEELVECQGNDYPNCDYAVTNTSDTNAADFGEEISGTPVNYEWRADVTGGDTDWSSCLGEINVQFASLNSSFVAQDTTITATYNAVTAVELSGKPQASPYTLGVTVLAGGMIIAMAISSFGYYRKQA